MAAPSPNLDLGCLVRDGGYHDTETRNAFDFEIKQMDQKVSKRDLIQKLLKGIETGDAVAAAVVNEAKYIQHNPQTHEGSEGLAALFARLSKTNPRITFVRVFEDGDFAFAHNEYDFSSLRVAFEVFRFEDGQAVEHWDNIQPIQGPNPSGRGMLDGATEITDLDRTEANRAFVRSFVEEVLVQRRLDRLEKYADNGLIQHNPDIADGISALRAALEDTAGENFAIQYDKVHRVLAEGNFVLCMSEGMRRGIHSSFYDLFRVSEGKIVEHWDTIEAIAPRSEWKNKNGKF
jgi:predicted SnoaL-like aldol condensation-catalyzing enzyme